MAKNGKSGSYSGSRSSGYGSGRASGVTRSFSSAQAHQHVGQSRFGYTKTYDLGTGYKMRKD